MISAPMLVDEVTVLVDDQACSSRVCREVGRAEEWAGALSLYPPEAAPRVPPRGLSPVAGTLTCDCTTSVLKGSPWMMTGAPPGVLRMWRAASTVRLVRHKAARPRGQLCTTGCPPECS